MDPESLRVTIISDWSSAPGSSIRARSAFIQPRASADAIGS